MSKLERTEKIVAILAVDSELNDLKAEAETIAGVKYISMPQETFDRILEFLRHPETGVRAGRLERRDG